MKYGEIKQVVRACKDGGCLNSNDMLEDGFIALVAVTGDDTYEVNLKTLKSKLGWKHVNLERAQLLNRTLPVEIAFDGQYLEIDRRQLTKLQITDETATAWAEKIIANMESERTGVSAFDKDIVMAPSTIAFAAIDKLNEKITNEIFIIIEKDPELKKEYDMAVASLSAKEVNRFIGRTVKTAYKLVKAEGRENNPSSTLISSHQKLKRVSN